MREMKIIYILNAVQAGTVKSTKILSKNSL
jgi:hypothetical protein